MANQPFDRTIINPREKPFSKDINQSLSQLDYSLRFFADHMFSRRSGDTNEARSVGEGFMPYSMKVLPLAMPDLAVTVTRGLAFFNDVTDTPSAIDGVLGLDDLSAYKPVVLTNDVSFAVPAPPTAGNSRIDIIEARIARETTDPTSRMVLDTTTGAFSPDIVKKTLAFTLDGSAGFVVSPAPSTAALSYKQGVSAPTGTEIEPDVTPGYVQIARINVGDSVTAITKSDIVDRRKLLTPNGVVQCGINWKQDWNSGTPLLEVRGVVGPPNVEFGIILDSGSGAHSAGSIAVTGLGQFTKAVCIINARGTAPTSGDIVGQPQNAFFASNTKIHGPVISGLQTSLAAGDLPLKVAIGQEIIEVGYGAVKASTGDNTASSLDVVYWDAMFFVSYD